MAFLIIKVVGEPKQQILILATIFMKHTSCLQPSDSRVTLKRSVILVLTVAKNVNFRLSGEEFFMISISKIMVPL